MEIFVTEKKFRDRLKLSLCGNKFCVGVLLFLAIYSARRVLEQIQMTAILCFACGKPVAGCVSTSEPPSQCCDCV